MGEERRGEERGYLVGWSESDLWAHSDEYCGAGGGKGGDCRRVGGGFLGLRAVAVRLSHNPHS